MRDEPDRRLLRSKRLSLALIAALAMPACADGADKPFPPGAGAMIDRCAKVEPLPGTPVMPVGYFFGFTDPTDAGDPCTSEFTYENVAHGGKRDGRYTSSASAAEISYTVIHNVAIAFAAYGTYTGWNNVAVTRTALTTVGDGVAINRFDAFRFDGLSTELFVRVIERAPKQPFAATLSIKPRWSRVDSITGYPAEGYGAEFKGLIDAVLTERVFAASNITYALGTQKFDVANASWLRASALSGSLALTAQLYAAEKQLVESIFAGGEARYRSVFAGLALDTLAGNAFFLGPTFAIGFPNERMLSLAWTPQLAGRSRLGLSSGSLDLDAFERHEFRLKFATPVAP